MFEFIIFDTIIYICAIIRYCIKKYKFDSRIVKKFEKINLESKYVKSTEIA